MVDDGLIGGVSEGCMDMRGPASTARITTTADMPPKSSKKIKELQREVKLHDKQLARAVDYAHKHPDESKAKIAKAFGVKANTLRWRCRGGVSRSVSRREQQLLTKGEEDAVVD